jgi:predicted transcriptional regulator
MIDPSAKRLLWYLIAGSKGGDNRIRIINLLKDHPYNINQLARTLDLIIKQFSTILQYLKRITWLAKWEKSMSFIFHFKLS